MCSVVCCVSGCGCIGDRSSVEFGGVCTVIGDSDSDSVDIEGDSTGMGDRYSVVCVPLVIGDSDKRKVVGVGVGVNGVCDKRKVAGVTSIKF